MTDESANARIRKIREANPGLKAATRADIEYLLTLTEKQRAVVEAARKSLKAGEHDGPCDGEDYDDACTLHLAAAHRRREALERALQWLGVRRSRENDDHGGPVTDGMD